MERVDSNFTEAEKSLPREELASLIRKRSFIPATGDDLWVLQGLYTQHLPENAFTISADITLPAGNGLINYKIAGEHKQVRF